MIQCAFNGGGVNQVYCGWLLIFVSFRSEMSIVNLKFIHANVLRVSVSELRIGVNVIFKCGCIKSIRHVTANSTYELFIDFDCASQCCYNYRVVQKKLTPFCNIISAPLEFTF
jgi:hypothetical protein